MDQNFPPAFFLLDAVFSKIIVNTVIYQFTYYLQSFVFFLFYWFFSYYSLILCSYLRRIYCFQLVFSHVESDPCLHRLHCWMEDFLVPSSTCKRSIWELLFSGVWQRSQALHWEPHVPGFRGACLVGVGGTCHMHWQPQFSPRQFVQILCRKWEWGTMTFSFPTDALHGRVNWHCQANLLSYSKSLNRIVRSCIMMWTQLPLNYNILCSFIHSPAFQNFSEFSNFINVPHSL